MLNRMLNAHYSVLALLSRVGFFGGLALTFCFAAAHVRGQIWFTMINYIAATAMAGAALKFIYLLLTVRGQVVVSIDATGFKDMRAVSTPIPWNMIQSVSPDIPSRSRNATGVELVVNPAFKDKLSILPAAKLLTWGYSIRGSVIRLDASLLDADSNEICRVANSYISDRS